MAHLFTLDLTPDRTRLRRFGFAAALVLVGTAASTHFRAASGGHAPAAHLPLTIVLLAASVLSAALAVVYPKGNLPFYRALSVISWPVGLVMSYVILTAFFFLVIGPVAIVMRAMGRDALGRRFERRASSYWVHRGERRENEAYFRQF